MRDWTAYRRDYNRSYRRRNRATLAIYNEQRRQRYRKQWLAYFKEYYRPQPHCQLCQRRLYWTHKQHDKRVCFDHRRGNEVITDISPRTWLQGRAFTDRNIESYLQ